MSRDGDGDVLYAPVPLNVPVSVPVEPCSDGNRVMAALLHTPQLAIEEIERGFHAMA
jgi:hypothetical protein